MFQPVPLGTATEVSGAVIAAPTALLGSGVIPNVPEEEVPSERRSPLGAFAAGGTGYTASPLAL